MFLHITLQDITPVHTYDGFLDDEIELYQTWLMTRLEPLMQPPPDAASTDNQKVELARTGYSVRGSPSDGVSFVARKDMPAPPRHVIDPQITFDLPDDITKKDTRYLFRFQMFHWESEHGTEKVRSTFSDPTLSIFVKALKATNEDSAAARSAALHWVDENLEKILKAGAVAAGVGANPWVAVGLQLLAPFELLLKAAATHGDSFIDRHQFVIWTRGTGTSVEWNVVPPDGTAKATITGGGLQEYADLQIIDGRGKNELKGTYRFRIIED